MDKERSLAATAQAAQRQEGNTLTGFVFCHRRRNAPRIHVAVCQKCRHGKTCKDFKRHVEPSLFEGKKRRVKKER